MQLASQLWSITVKVFIVFYYCKRKNRANRTKGNGINNAIVLLICRYFFMNRKKIYYVIIEDVFE